MRFSGLSFTLVFLSTSVLTAGPIYHQDFEGGAGSFPRIFCGPDGGGYLAEIQTGAYALDFPVPDLSLADLRLESFRGEVGFGLYFRDSLGYPDLQPREGGLGLWVTTYDADGVVRLRFDDLAGWPPSQR